MSRSDKLKGRYNSSKTRVEPVFDMILDGADWQKFFDLVRMAKGGMPGHVQFPRHAITGEVKVCYGDKASKGRGEAALPPKAELLHWLVDNMGGPCLNKPGTGASQERKNLFEGKGRGEAHGEIKSCTDKRVAYPRKWYVLEGATRPDVYIKTDEFVLLIEGKRTEPNFTRHTTWMKHRDQMIRHMDSCYPMCGHQPVPVFGLYILSDANDSAFKSGKPKFPDLQSKISWYHEIENWKSSLPHRTNTRAHLSVVAEMQRHFLGYITWNDVAAAFSQIKLK